MSASLSSLWQKNVKQMGKAQKKGVHLLHSLMPGVSGLLKVPKPLKPLKTSKTRKPAAALSANSAAKAPPLPGMWRKSYFSSAGDRVTNPNRRTLYWLYLPAGDSEGPRPLVVMLHGCNQTAADFAAATRMNALAEREGFAVLYPQQSTAVDSHRCWHWYKRSTQQGQGDVQVVTQMIRDVQRKHGLDTTRTYLAGISAGAALANLVALCHPRLVAAVGLHSAPVFGTSDSAISGYHTMQHGSALAHGGSARLFAHGLPPKTGMPVILIHGERDTVVRGINVAHLTEQFRHLNADLLTAAQPVEHSFPPKLAGPQPRNGYKTTVYMAGRKPQVVRCEIALLGHAWSGGDASVPFASHEGPDAAVLMWRFFARHRRMVSVEKAAAPA